MTDSLRHNPPGPALKPSLWTPARLRRIALAALGGIGAALLLSICRGYSSSLLLARGDFPAFYSAAVIAYRGELEQLYNIVLQHQIQSAVWPGMEDRILAYAYPPYVAQIIAPLALLPPAAGKALITVIMVFLAAVCALLLSRSYPDACPSALNLFSYFMSFSPVLIGVLGAQNNALTMSAYAAALYTLRRKNASLRGQFAAGLFIGVWFLKPHFGLLAFLLLCCSGSAAAAAGSAAAGLFLYLLSAAELGLLWPQQFLSQAAVFAKLDFLHNSHQMVSLLGVSNALAYALGAAGPLRTALLWTAVVLSAVCAAAAGLRVICGRKTGANGRSELALLLAGPMAVLVSPHTLFYDLGLAIVPAAVLFRRRTDAALTAVLLLCLFSLPLGAFKADLPFQPLVLLAGGVFLLVMKKG